MRCKSILIIEDDRDIRETLEQVLKMEGYLVYTARDGGEGMEALKTIPGPCLILLDLMMQGMNGWDFLEAQKQNNVFASLPVVVVSALDATSALIKDKPVTAVGYIRKPVGLSTLIEIVQQYCGIGEDELANFSNAQDELRVVTQAS